jgi:L-asparagine oxygenase
MPASLLFSFLAPAPPRMRVEDSHRDAWMREACALRYPEPGDLSAWTQFRQAAARMALDHLPATITGELWRFYPHGGSDSVRIENLPVDPALPPTPRDGMRPTGKSAVSEAVVLGLIAPWAEILSYLNEKRGAPIHEITPVPGREYQQSNAGRTAFGYHSDNAFLPARFRQEGLLLFGLRNQDTATLVLSAEQIAEAAPAALIEALARPAYRHACPHSYQLPETVQSAARPILWRDQYGKMRVTAASSTIEPADAEASRALEDFRALTASLEPLRAVVGPGTALLFKDSRVLHGRDAVGGDRWIQRAYFRESLDELRAATRSDSRAFAFDVRRLLQGPGGVR